METRENNNLFKAGSILAVFSGFYIFFVPLYNIAGWTGEAPARSHKPNDADSNSAPATKFFNYVYMDHRSEEKSGGHRYDCLAGVFMDLRYFTRLLVQRTPGQKPGVFYYRHIAQSGGAFA